MAATVAQPSRAQRVVKILSILTALLVTAVALVFVVAAGVFHLKYAEPDPDLAKRFAAAMREADGSIDLTVVHADPWDSVSLIGPFTGLDAVRACLGVSGWEQDGALADHLKNENQSALVFVRAGEVTAATWSIWQQLPFEAPANICTVPRSDSVFQIGARTVPDPKAGRVDVYRLEPSP